MVFFTEDVSRMALNANTAHRIFFLAPFLFGFGFFRQRTLLRLVESFGIRFGIRLGQFLSIILVGHFCQDWNGDDCYAG